MPKLFLTDEEWAEYQDCARMLKYLKDAITIQNLPYHTKAGYENMIPVAESRISNLLTISSLRTAVKKSLELLNGIDFAGLISENSAQWCKDGNAFRKTATALLAGAKERE